MKKERTAGPQTNAARIPEHPGRGKILQQAERTCARLLPTAARQARKGNSRLLAEILHFLRPTPPQL